MLTAEDVRAARRPRQFDTWRAAMHSGSLQHNTYSERVYVASTPQVHVTIDDPSAAGSATARVEAPVSIQMFDRDPLTVGKQIGRGIERALHG
ncbi:hypothetical protein RL72_03302 [Microbacterium azadirachtae]|uniref:Uncharacterized protein n=1 Tax=Microbacterium azadirachtae TaxID=582680 RepID=A0A0F0KFC3_9MICO|nr:hypothetical protein [Microbacterium azadirachtae]KJL18830.1 hypothetical protein RL72_03302 [Microbacterium azadirachtae]